jgi:hypothetical protein
MNFRDKCHYYGSTPAADLIEVMIAKEDRYGELETLRARVNELTRIVGYMASLMPPDALRQLANHFGWEEVK